MGGAGADSGAGDEPDLITDRDRLVIAVGCLTPNGRRVLGCVCGAGKPVTVVDVIIGVKLCYKVVHQLLVKMTGLGLIKRWRERHRDSTATGGGTPWRYAPADGVSEIQAGLSLVCGAGGYLSAATGVKVLRVVRSLIAEEVWPSRRIVAEETGIHPDSAELWSYRFRQWRLFPETHLTPRSSHRLLYTFIAKKVHRTRKPKLPSLVSYRDRKSVHKDHSLARSPRDGG